jgi:hypothetical protein
MFDIFKKKKKPVFKFNESPNTACFTCDHVLKRERPILYASHYSDDGSWQFTCGKSDHTEANAKIISLKQATEIDESINDLYEMPLGVGAERETQTSKWIPFRLS